MGLELRTELSSGGKRGVYLIRERICLNTHAKELLDDQWSRKLGLESPGILILMSIVVSLGGPPTGIITWTRIGTRHNTTIERLSKRSTPELRTLYPLVVDEGVAPFEKHIKGTNGSGTVVAVQYWRRRLCSAVFAPDFLEVTNPPKPMH